MREYNRDLALEILSQIFRSAKTVIKRFEPIQSAEYFVNSEAGVEKLDAICMQLIAIGESLKNLDKVTKSSLLKKYQQVDWKKAKVYSYCKSRITGEAHVVCLYLEPHLPVGDK